MTTIYDRVNTALATLSPAVPFAMNVLMGTLPDIYITYSVISGVPAQHAENSETARTYRVQVNVMSRTDLVNLPNVNAAMLSNKFTRGPERELPKDSSSDHFGLAKDYFYLENQ